MRRRPIIVFGVVLVAFLAGASWLWWHPPAAEPLYQGKPLSYWLDGLAIPASAPIPGRPTFAQANAALRAAGTNAIPTLLRLVRKKQWMFEWEFNGMVYVFHLEPGSNRPTVPPQRLATLAFHALGQTASNALPELLRIYDQKRSRLSANQFVSILGDVGPAAKDEVPRLLALLRQTNAVVPLNVIQSLMKIHSQPGLVVPVLLKALADANYGVRLCAIVGLWAFGPEAKAAVPALVSLTQDRDLMLRLCAGEALMEIDLDAAINAGIKVYEPFSFADIPSATSLANKLNQSTVSISSYLSGRLSARTRREMADWASGVQFTGPPQSMVDGLNEIIRGPSIYDAQRFAGIELRPETQRLLAGKPQGDALIRLNRMLLEDAYPLEITSMKSRIPLPPFFYAP